MSIPISNDTKLETKMYNALIREYGESKASTYITDYKDARNKLLENILEEIKRIENGLTDHSERHIRNVLDNAYYLLGDDCDNMSALELYILCLCILFHDVGNIHGREGHFKKDVIQKIYEFVRDTTRNPRFKEEKVIVSNIASVHSGKSTRNKSNPDDTISDLTSPSFFAFHNTPIRYAEIAAILRFADELAEGPQRTSAYMLLNGLIKDLDAYKHHSNSYSFTCNINKKDRRLAINYHIATDRGKTIEDKLKYAREHLEFTVKRIEKINKERTYCRHYSVLLSQYSKVSVQYFFTINGVEETLDIEPLEFSDLTFESKSMGEINTDYSIDNLLDKLKDNLPNE